MNKKVAFIVKHFTERGTELSTYNYAKYNESLLSNQSIIIAFNKASKDDKKGFINTTRILFSKKFKIIEIKLIEEMKEIINNENISHVYIQSHGFYRDEFKFNKKNIWGNCKTIYHYVFGPMARQGSDIRCVVGADLNKRFKKKIPVLPLIVNKHKKVGNLRNYLKIDSNATVFGRHGGLNTFDLNFVKEAIKESLQKRKDIFFIFLNTEKFINHERVIYLNKTISLKEKSLFIDTCDYMIHARKDGETFGLAVAEFSAANKPVICYGKSKDNEHLRILKGKAIIYKTKKELLNILLYNKRGFKKDKNFNCYEKYSPEKVMRIFNDICLEGKSTNKSDFCEIIRDIPWEILIFIQAIIQIIKSIIIKVIPIKLKVKLKNFFKNFYKL